MLLKMFMIVIFYKFFICCFNLKILLINLYNNWLIIWEVKILKVVKVNWESIFYLLVYYVIKLFFLGCFGY